MSRYLRHLNLHPLDSSSYRGTAFPRAFVLGFIEAPDPFCKRQLFNCLIDSLLRGAFGRMMALTLTKGAVNLLDLGEHRNEDVFLRISSVESLDGSQHSRLCRVALLLDLCINSLCLCLNHFEFNQTQKLTEIIIGVLGFWGFGVWLSDDCLYETQKYLFSIAT